MSALVFNFKEDDKKIKEYLDDIVYNDISNIIISYYTSSWVFNHIECKIKEDNYFTLFRFVDDKLIFIQKKEVKDNYLKFDFEGNIITEIYIRKIFVDGIYIYLIDLNQIHIVNYQTKRADTITICRPGYVRHGLTIVTERIIPYIHCIKNKIIYTYNLDAQCINNIKILADSKENEHQLKNIVIYYEVRGKKAHNVRTMFGKTDYFFTCDLTCIHINDNNDFVMSIQDYYLDSPQICMLNAKTWCILSRFRIQVMYHDDYQIICIVMGLSVNKLICINKSSGKICEYFVGSGCWAGMNKDVIIVENSKHVNIYKALYN